MTSAEVHKRFLEIKRRAFAREGNEPPSNDAGIRALARLITAPIVCDIPGHNTKRRPPVPPLAAHQARIIRYVMKRLMAIAHTADAKDAMWRCERDGPNAFVADDDDAPTLCWCIRCDIARVERVESRVRGGDYATPLCCLRPKAVKRNSLMVVNAVAERRLGFKLFLAPMPRSA